LWAFSEVIDGMAEACKAFDTPVISGNVSFYNETEGPRHSPTPVIGMVGLIDDVRKVIQPGFKNAGDCIALLGATRDDLSISEYARSKAETRREGGCRRSAQVPRLNLDGELAVQTACLRAAAAGCCARLMIVLTEDWP
jgi:phosphoribosylformylglycinamidine synthase